jgi:hypothetical protein
MLAAVQRILPPGTKKFLHGTRFYALSSKGEQGSGKIGIVSERHEVRMGDEGQAHSVVL